jgi:outer membrane protein OmpA-like peptidoglycan-associated protein
MDQELINRLNGEINTLRNDLNACLARTCPACPACPKPETVTKTDCPPAAVGVVKFALGSSVITNDQQINVYNAADYLKNNPSVNLKVVGYADKKTGNPTINMKLSEQRAKGVTKMLVNKYGIPENRIETSWDGDKVQPYSTNEWNRVVIFVPQK